MNDQETQEREDFGQILAEFEQEAPAKRDDPAVGAKVSGKILSVGEESVFVDLGAKSEGRIDTAELKDAEGNVTVKEGDTLEATVTGTDPETGVEKEYQRRPNLQPFLDDPDVWLVASIEA